MTYYADLSPYTFFAPEDGVVNVGWLDPSHEFAEGTLDAEIVERLRQLARYSRAKQTRGFHRCGFCPGTAEHPSVLADGKLILLGSAEIRVTAADVTYAAPDLVLHYIERHRYSPPAAFIEAVSLGPLPGEV